MKTSGKRVDRETWFLVAAHVINAKLSPLSSGRHRPCQIFTIWIECPEPSSKSFRLTLDVTVNSVAFCA
ncbi:hypothetical protein TNCV_537281 [Trichonephila clavipes]|nr:hypothetical protein TNCV_537281 [Trichonephila clavipes]